MAALHFDPVKSYTGTYTFHDITYTCYTVKYCEKPIVGLPWSEGSSEQYFTMNIKVPSSLSDAERAEAPLLMYNPWGGDFGHIPAGPEKIDNPLKEAVLKRGWILLEPGMRGNNCFTEENGVHTDYGKIPRPLADIKAAIRYLRYEDNIHTIPGNKDRIWIAGTSSGGCCSVIIASSGDSELFTPYLEEIGAAGTSDAVYGCAPSCPVMNRANGDSALTWERWPFLPEKADPINRLLYDAFPPYLRSLNLKAEFSTEHIDTGTLLDETNYREYLYAYVKKAALKFFRDLGSEEAVEAYLQQMKPVDRMYSTPETSRDWIRPVYDAEGHVIDILGTYEDFWRYVCGEDYYDPSHQINWQYDRIMVTPDRMQKGSGTVSQEVGFGMFGTDACPSNFSFGKPEDFAAVYNPLGIQVLEQRGIPVSDEYKALYELQRNCVNPMYFLIEEAGKTRIAKHWYLRTGTVDLVTPHPLFIGLGTWLLNHGIDTDIAFVWDQKHGLTTDIEGFLSFTENL